MSALIEKISKQDRAVFIVFFCALLLRIIYLVQIQDSPFLNFPQIDALWHHLWAREIASGNVIGDEVFFRAPLYPYFLGLVYALFGDGPNAIRVIQSILGSLSCVLVFLISREIFNRRTAIIAGFVAAFYPILIYFDNELLITSLFIFLALLLFYFALRTKSESSHGRIYLLGFLMGLAAIARPTILIFVPLLLFWILYYRKAKKGTAGNNWIRGLLVIAGIMSAVLPVTIRNYAVGNDLVLISYQGGVNFWIGNNEQADGKTAGAPGHFKAYGEYQDNVKFSSEKVAEMDLGREMRPSEISSYWYGKGLEFIAGNPGQALGLMIKKFYFAWNAYEIESNRDIYSQREYSSLFSVLLWHKIIGFPFGLLAPLAIAGIVIMFRNWKNRYFLLIGIIIAYQIILISFFVTSRFRAPTIPFLIMAGAFALDYLIAYRRDLARIMLPAGIIIVTLIFCNTTLFGVKPSEESRFSQARASIFLRQNQADSAIVYARRAIEENPNDPAGYDFLGLAFEQKENYSEAVEYYRKAIELNPGDAFAYTRMGYCLYLMNELETARAASMNAIAIDSTIIEAYVNLGNIYKAMDQPNAALEIYEKAYSRDSSNLSLLNNYSIALARARNFEQAINAAERAVELNPDYSLALVTLANLYFQTGDILKAEQFYIRALEIDSELNSAKISLAQLYLRTNRELQARNLVQEVLRDDPDNPGARRLLNMMGQ